ncbi:Pls/PosA family non-ribosomal peptide synthetase [Galactobacter valiniphilus]|uniref:Pls/PosA family non-ribosomal peptide synthetase n=1 Tax=Galactobacter valiniphilus TaxID=2676122 RepID=UPI001F24B241|nr:Pls/PosA family non-ribosomal peptide synthetase [Galactobacter valiniphilus]
MPSTPDVAPSVVPTDGTEAHGAPEASHASAYAAQFPGGERAPEPRTLVDILRASAAAHPEAPAIDDGELLLDYAALLEAVDSLADRLRSAGHGAGDRIGIRLPSGTRQLYVSILAVLAIGAAYVPVDTDDPAERAELVFGEAGIAALLSQLDGDTVAVPARAAGSLAAASREPLITDDAWIIFTSGSTGTPKGVAVTHRNAAAFVDAEARLFLQAEPLGPGDRVLAGLSVAFDASCEEMWLAWRHGACLVPAPRELVRTGADLGPWLSQRGVTAVSTVPTLAALWPAEALEEVRLLIFGGEACPPELAARLAQPGREVWNTYGPTEATVVACAAPLTGEGPVRIGLPLDGWDLAVVDPATGVPVAEGGTGELIIGGVGLARYLDPEKDAAKYAPMPTLGWERAYRSGDLVVNDHLGLLFVGRADDQVKIGGRRIELGELDSALQNLPGVSGAAAAVRTTAAGNQILVGYLAAEHELDLKAARETLLVDLPAALVPLLAQLDSLPTKTSGKVDRAALPWPLPGAQAEDDGALAALGEDAGFIARSFSAVLGGALGGLDADFFAVGGGSLTAARLVSLLRERHPLVTVADLYSHPRLGALIDFLGASTATPPPPPREVARTRRGAQFAQTLAGIPLFVLVGMRWLTYLAIGGNLLSAAGVLQGHHVVSWWWILLSWTLFVSPPGRMAISVAAARLLLRGVGPGEYPRSGSVHLRLWLAQHIADLVDPVSLAGAVWVKRYARGLGATIGKDVTLHSVPPVTGLLRIGDGASIEPEVDLSGYWIDGDRLIIGELRIGEDAVVGARSTLHPGAKVGGGADVAPGSAVIGKVKARAAVAGSPARRIGKARGAWPAAVPPSHRGAKLGFALGGAGLALLPWVSVALAVLSATPFLRGHASLGQAASSLWLALPLAAAVWFLSTALIILITVRLLSLKITEGWHPAEGAVAWRIWATERLLDVARDLLFPLYASLATPVWLRLLGAKVGRDVEASTVLLIPKMTTIGDGAFLADDTLVASYELGGGWLHVAPAKVGKRAFLGNSGMAAAGRRVPKGGLVAVLSATPPKAKAGSSWLGSPPVKLRRAAVEAQDDRTYAPPTRLKVARGAWELLRLVAVLATVATAAGVLVVLDVLWNSWGPLAGVLLSGSVLLAAGGAAALVAIAVKWLLVGRLREGEHPLWSSFIWRNEVVDAFIEMLCAPWFARAASGTPALVWFLRGLGAKIGHGVWCESYWLPEADLVRLGDSSTVNRGCVVQTHLFHDRVMAIDTVQLAAGSTLGPNSVILPAAALGAGSTTGPASLVMRGEVVPAGSRWTGNPVEPWTDAER